MTLRLRVAAFAALHFLGATPVIAQSGVLVGVAKPGGYETLWIVRDASQPIRATIPDLLVPRADGWWRVGTAVICSTGGPEGQWMEVLWRARADSSPVIAEICHELPRNELPLPIYAEDSAAKDSLGKQLVRCSWSNISIKFVSADYIAISERSGQTEECEPRGGRWYQSHYVSRFNGDSSLAVTEFALSSIDSVGRVALAQAAIELAKDEVCANIVQAVDPDELLEMGSEWYPVRTAGRWRPALTRELGLGECELVPLVDVALSSALTGPDSLQPAWGALAKQVKGLVDALASPSGDLVILRSKDSLFVHLGTGQQRLGRRVGAMSFTDRQIVMIQWATGRHVARWSQEIAAMMRKGLQGPRVEPAPPSQ